MTEQHLNQIAKATIDCAFRVHSALGPGLLESSYKACLGFEIAQNGLSVRLEVPVPLIYAGQQIAEVGYRLDVLVEEELILEIKAIEALLPVHKAQLLSYLRLSNKRLGLLMNFNEVHLKDGVRRVVNNL